MQSSHFVGKSPPLSVQAKVDGWPIYSSAILGEISGGGNIMAWMEAQHDTADHVLCVISENYLKAPYSSWERQAAQWAATTDRPNFALPVFIQPCKAPTLLAPFKRCDLYECSEEQAQERLNAFLMPAAKAPRGPFPGKLSAAPASAPERAMPPFPGIASTSTSPNQPQKNFENTERSDTAATLSFLTKTIFMPKRTRTLEDYVIAVGLAALAGIIFALINAGTARYPAPGPVFLTSAVLNLVAALVVLRHARVSLAKKSYNVGITTGKPRTRSYLLTGFVIFSLVWISCFFI